jgi:hypothetical protein
MRQGYKIATASEVGEFIRMLVGGICHRVYRTGERSEDFAINFSDRENCISAWRALNIVGFKGKVPDLSVYSPENAQAMMISPMRVVMSQAAWKVYLQGKGSS